VFSTQTKLTNVNPHDHFPTFVIVFQRIYTINLPHTIKPLSSVKMAYTTTVAVYTPLQSSHPAMSYTVSCS